MMTYDFALRVVVCTDEVSLALSAAEGASPSSRAAFNRSRHFGSGPTPAQLRPLLT
jgi:hypothetical protein